MSDTTTRRAGTGARGGYTRTHAHIVPDEAPSRSCGRCGRHHPVSALGWKRHPVLGFVLTTCPKKAAR